jgi:hypothetical protein
MAATRTVILDIFHLCRHPAPEFEIVRNDPRSLFQSPLEHGPHFIVGLHRQIHRN